MADSPSTPPRPYLDFEQPIADVEQRIAKMRAHAEAENLNLGTELVPLQEKLEKLQDEIYSNLTRWQRYQMARHPQRPHARDCIDFLLTDFVELHGDRAYGDDPAIIGGFGKLGQQSVLIIGQQKGRNTKENIHRNMGLAHPEGYRKALRLMKLAAKFGKPVITLIDSPGAYPGIGSEERSVAEAIARNLFEISRLPIPIVVVVLGEGGSGGALGIGIGDRILMMENAWYSVINPESCSLILWRTRDKRTEAAEALRITAPDLLELGIIDEIIPEPLGGAHRDWDTSLRSLRNSVTSAIDNLVATPPSRLLDERMKKFDAMGKWDET